MTASPEKVELRIWGDPSQPTLVYLPGLHGDWTLISGFRAALAGRARLVEVTYPRTLTWSLEGYAQGVEASLAEQGIPGGWLIGESFGSQVAWPLAARGKFQAEGIILAGGFARHPMQWGARLAEWIMRVCPLSWLKLILVVYGKLARLRFRSEPQVRAGLDAFLARRTDLDRRAAMHRLRLVATNDPTALAQNLQKPVYALSGWLDPIVPWLIVRRSLRRVCPALRDYRIVAADHNVLSTASATAAEQVLEWINQKPQARPK